MALMSKPYKFTIQMLGSYLGQLYMNPVRTKSITASVIALLGNYTGQSLAGDKINSQTLMAFGLFGLLFGGSVPHYFYEGLMKFVSTESRFAPLIMLFIERLLYMPVYQFFSLYTIARFEMKSHQQALSNVMRYYLPLFESNIKYLTLIQFVNLYFVPPVFRVLVSNIIGFIWVVYFTRKRTAPPKKAGRRQ